MQAIKKLLMFLAAVAALICISFCYKNSHEFLAFAEVILIRGVLPPVTVLGLAWVGGKGLLSS